MTIRPRFAALMLALFAIGCVSTSLRFVDQRTALENQLLGTYEDLSEELVLAATVRAARSDAGRETDRLKIAAIRARELQEFNRDDVEEMKRDGSLGEANDGHLSARSAAKARDHRYERRRAAILEEENGARDAILRFVMLINPNLGPADLPALHRALAHINAERAKKGEKIQRDDGVWIVR